MTAGKVTPPKKAVKSSKAPKPLILWNGGFLHLGVQYHGYAAASSRADVARLLVAYMGYKPPGLDAMLAHYWNKGLWGTPMAGITPVRGLWIAPSNSNPTPVRVVP